ncbi:MAG: flagellar basal body rod protein FlgB [Gammaproteobacteria bacterium]|nr:flagellar basal body rod protein FlgB [Gammaproteobacteria bacterium]
MKISFENALGPHPAALELRSLRTQIIANNIANADTPNYKARDMSFESMLREATEGRSGSLTTTHPRHMSTRPKDAEASLLYRIPMLPSIDGNTVDGHVEQAEFANNALHFQASLRFLNGKFRGLIAAIRGE